MTHPTIPPVGPDDAGHDGGDANDVVRYELVPVTVRGVSGTRVTVTHTSHGATACAMPGAVRMVRMARMARRAARRRAIVCAATYARAA